MQPRDRHPRQRAHGRSRIGDHEGARGQAACGQGRAGIEPEPPEPQQRCAEHHHRGVVIGLALMLPQVDAPPQHQRRDQG